MRSLFLSLILLVTLNICAINIIPHPYEYDVNPTYAYHLNEQTSFICKQKSLIPIVEVVAQTMRSSTGLDLPIGKKTKNSIYLSLDKKIKNPEAYTLRIYTNAIEIYGGSPTGVYYGLQTLLQMLPSAIESDTLVVGVEWTLPIAFIEDFPRFQYRGMHVDPCRHFLPIAHIKKQIDWMSKFKLNRLHLHLTDDQLWTFEVKKYPRLTEVGTRRINVDGSVYEGGYFSQDELRELVEYASLRGVTIIPEIEMPGHAMAALTAYPEYGCTGGPYQVRTTWGVEDHLLCAGNDSVFSFIEDILTELTDIFPSEYIHIGGDECPTVIWHQCPRCQARMKAEKLSTEVELHGYFIRRVEQILHKLGRKMIGWDEILDGGASQSATVMSWRGNKGGIKAANQGNQAIMTPWDVCYFDHYQGSKLFEPMAQSGFLPLQKVYEWEPIPAEIQPSNRHLILGGQANLWSEYILSSEHAEYMIYPRILALSEVLWTSHYRDYDNFVERLSEQQKRLDYGHINYHIPLPEGPQAQYIEFIDSVNVTLTNSLGYDIYYQLDYGQGPSEWRMVSSNNCGFSIFRQGSRPLVVNSALLKSFTSFNGRNSDTIEVTYQRIQDPHPSAKNLTHNGLYRQRAYGYFPNTDSLDYIKFDITDLVDSLIYDRNDSYFDSWIEVYTGYFQVDSTAQYLITTDLEELWIDDIRIIDNNGRLKRNQTQQALMVLEAGAHSLKAVYNNCVNDGFPAHWRKPEIRIRTIDESKFRVLKPSDFYR